MCELSKSIYLVGPMDGTYPSPALHVHLGAMDSQRRRPRVTRPSKNISRFLSAVNIIADQHAQRLEATTKLEEHLSALREYKKGQLELDPRHIKHQEVCERQREIRKQWLDEILPTRPIFEDQVLGGSLDGYLSNKTPWSGPEYSWAYPKTRAFLSEAEKSAKSKLSSCTVWYYNPRRANNRRDPGGLEKIVPLRENGKRLSVPERLWSIIQQQKRAEWRLGGTTEMANVVKSRTICAMDISPAVAAILLAITPRSVSSNLLLSRSFTQKY